jgi:hypothetical protein
MLRQAGLVFCPIRKCSPLIRKLGGAGLAEYFPGNVQLWHLGLKTLVSAAAASTLTALRLPFGMRIERADDHERSSNIYIVNRGVAI